VIPAAYHAAKHVTSTGNLNRTAAMTDHAFSDLDEDAQRGLLIISRGTAVLLLGVYIAYLVFQLKTHASLFIPRPNRRTTNDEVVGDLEAHSGEPVQAVEEDVAKMSVVAAGLGYVRIHHPCLSGLETSQSSHCHRRHISRRGLL
jgi:Ca2+:H+ antiporter